WSAQISAMLREFLRASVWCQRTKPHVPDRLASVPPEIFLADLPIAVTSTAESALAGSAALVPVGSAPELSHKRTEPRLSCRACGTYLHGLSAPSSNLPIRLVPTPRRCAPGQPLDHRAWQWPRHDLALQLAKDVFVAIGRTT